MNHDEVRKHDEPWSHQIFNQIHGEAHGSQFSTSSKYAKMATIHLQRQMAAVLSTLFATTSGRKCQGRLFFTARADSTFCSGSLPSSIQESTWDQFADRISQMLAYGTSKMWILEFGKSGPSYILIQPYCNRELIFQITFLEFHVTFGWSMFCSNLQSFKIPGGFCDIEISIGRCPKIWKPPGMG